MQQLEIDQLVVEPVDMQVQEEALNILLETLKPDFLAIPKDKLNLFPPHALWISQNKRII